MTLNNGLKVVGLTTFSNSVDVNATTAFGDDVTFETANTKNILFDKSDNRLEFGDNVKLALGDSEDFNAYHDGTDTRFENSTNDLFIINTGDDIVLRTTDDLSLIHI